MYQGNGPNYSGSTGGIPGGATSKGSGGTKNYTVNPELREFYKLPALTKID